MISGLIELQRPVYAIYLDENKRPMPEPTLIRFAGIHEDDGPVFLEVDEETGEFFDPANSIDNFGGYFFDRLPTAEDLKKRFPEKRGTLGKS